MRRISMARIFHSVAQEAFRDREAVEEALQHADEFCTLEDTARSSGFWGLPPEPGSWILRDNSDTELLASR